MPPGKYLTEFLSSPPKQTEINYSSQDSICFENLSPSKRERGRNYEVLNMWYFYPRKVVQKAVILWSADGFYK